MAPRITTMTTEAMVTRTLLRKYSANLASTHTRAKFSHRHTPGSANGCWKISRVLLNADTPMMAMGASTRNALSSMTHWTAVRPAPPRVTPAPPRAVDARSLDIFLRHGVDAGQEDDGRETQPAPRVHHDQREQRGRSITQPGTRQRAGMQQRQDLVHEAKDGIEKQPPQESHDDQ